MSKSRMLQVLEQHEAEVIERWVQELRSEETYRHQVLGEENLRAQCRHFLELLKSILQRGEEGDFRNWEPLREHLGQMMQQWLDWGAQPVEVAGFVLMLKRPLIQFQIAAGQPPEEEGKEFWRVAVGLDRLALWTTEFFQRRLQQQIQRQQEELLELSTPVVALWDGVLALPLIGTLDSARTQVVMESLLQRIVDTGADVAILDITGVPTVDTMVAQHLLKAVTAARLMGANCIISGIRPSIAQTMVQLGIDLREVTTKATLADAFAVALNRLGLHVVSDGAAETAREVPS